MTEPYLPMDLELLDAKGLYLGRDTDETLFISYVNGKYWLKSRDTSAHYGAEWTTHFRVTKQIAREIVSLGYADWWVSVDRSAR